MKNRIVIWAAAGLLIAGFWALYFLRTGPIPISPAELMWTLSRVTCPIVFASFYFHFPISVYWVMLANAATYALIGLVTETVRRQLRPAR